MTTKPIWIAGHRTTRAPAHPVFGVSAAELQVAVLQLIAVILLVLGLWAMVTLAPLAGASPLPVQGPMPVPGFAG